MPRLAALGRVFDSVEPQIDGAIVVIQRESEAGRPISTKPRLRKQIP